MKNVILVVVGVIIGAAVFYVLTTKSEVGKCLLGSLSCDDSVDGGMNEGIASGVMKNIYNGMKKKDYKLFATNFHSSMDEGLPKSLFESTLKEFDDVYGDFPAPQWIGFYRVQGTYITLWKAVAPKTNNDILFTLSLNKIDEKWQVVGLYLR